ncbi:MAG: YgjP-like metallopeptidase domain-containing protein [Marinicellaceae bacterium]
MTDPLSYINAYPQNIKDHVKTMLDQNSLGKFLIKKYPKPHDIHNDKNLRDYALQIKNKYMKKSAPLSKVSYDGKIHVINNALGLHSYVPRVQGTKVKVKNELRVSTVFKKSPLALLNMIVVHELAHLKEKQHDKAFYQLCQHMLPDYHQLEFDTRLFMIQNEIEAIYA